MGNYKSDVSERVAYHIFYMNLRTETFAFSRQQDGITNYTAVHDGQLYPLGTTNQATTLSHIVFSNSIYGFQGDERNYSSLENTTNPDTGANEEIYKMNTRLGQYSLSLTSPVFAPTPDEFGLDVSVNGDAFITGRLPSGDTFNVLSNAPGFSLSSVLKRDLTGITVYPIYIR